MKKTICLGVNIDHVATIRQSRGTSYPDILEAARICEKAGAEGITVHLREDRRHIQDRDVFLLRKSIKTKLNLEMANHPDIVRVALKVRPDEVCLVPERRRELTTEGGLDVASRLSETRALVRRLSGAGIAVSLFIDPDPRQIDAAAATGAPFIELHTGSFCNAKGLKAKKELTALIRAAQRAHKTGIKVNAGHGISLENIKSILSIPWLDTLNIGHSIVARAVFVGLGKAVAEMRRAMNAYRGGIIS